jgi:ATP-dependent exoDNAse (exonuclease V) alpha subunit
LRPLAQQREAAGGNGEVYALVEPFAESSECIFVEVNGKTVCIQNAVFEGVRHGLPADVDYGYAMTVHKSEGSEWPNVVVVDECQRRDMRAQWFYTTLTRAFDRILVLRGLR